MERISLNGTWQFKALDTYNTLPRKRQHFLHWMTANVPGTVHTDLMHNRQMPDPFFGTTETEVQWVNDLQWLYRRRFAVPSSFLVHDAMELVAEGLDTYATISINGQEVGQTANMFIAHRFDVKKHLRNGNNVIEILFDSPTVRSKQLEQQHGALRVALQAHRVYVRKAQYSFGWDWGPELPTSGIWRDISLQAYSSARLQHPFIKTLSVTEEEAVVELSIDIGRRNGDALQLRASVAGHGVALERTIEVQDTHATLTLSIPRPKLWWPNGLGDQAMYNASFSLWAGGEEIDAMQVPFGIRTVRLLQEPDARGKSFVLEINGTRVFCKGADWIPCDSFLPRVSAATYERLLHLARDAHMNMLRVWGGGIYEHDTFYRLCDELGLMVWQDFMFACGEYPEEPWFVQQVTEEAEQVVRRLRNHPSLVLWCGNNECEWLFCTENAGKSPDDMRGAVLFRDVLPSICCSLDGTRPYWRSSPFGDGFPNDESSGNHHQWNVWSGWKDFSEYENDNARFVSEFGFQAPAHHTTLESVLSSVERYPQSREMEHHNKQIEGMERLIRFLAAHQNLTTNFGEFIYRSQLVQAEALKRGVEHWRRRKFDTAGALFWQLNDCWPVISWSVIDSSLRPKAAYYYARRFFAPVLLSFRRTGTDVELWLTNDTLRNITSRLHVTFRMFLGEVVSKLDKRVSVPANASQCVARLDLSRFSQYDPSLHYFHAVLDEQDEGCEQRFFLLEPKHLRLPVPLIRARILDHSKGELLLKVTTRHFVKDVFLDVKDEDAFFEDNYFDLDARTSKVIRVHSMLPPSKLIARLTISSLYDRK